MWWDQLEKAKNHGRKMKYLFELKLGTMTMEEYEKRFFELLKYVDFIKDEKVKIERFLSGLPSFYNDKIQYDNPKTLEETIRRSIHIYEKSIGRLVFQKAWNGKMKGKKDQRQKDFKTPFFRNISQANRQGKPTQNEHKTAYSLGKRSMQQPVQCWGCEGNNLYRDFPHKRERMRTIHNIQ
jgi:hypothetical protein